jgi:hypothetical protein
MNYSEVCRRRIEHLERQGPPEKPTKEKAAEYAHLNGISKGEAWERLRNLHGKETAAYRVLVDCLKNYL